MGGGFVRTDYKIEPGEIMLSAVTTTTIASLAVTTTKIALSAITSAQLGVDSVYTSSIQQSAVSSDKLASGAVTDVKILASSVSQNSLMPSALTFDNLIALGSYSSATQAGGKDSISHGLLTAPVGVWMTPIAADALTAFGRHVRLMSISAAAFSFIAVSAPPAVSQLVTCVGSLVASTAAVTFIWGAHI